MDAYIYQGALHCKECGAGIRHEIDSSGAAPEDPEDESSYDSDDYPEGPYPDGGGESDCPQHCDSCGVFLENPLTKDGEDYVLNAIIEHLAFNRGRKDIVETWADFYFRLGNIQGKTYFDRFDIYDAHILFAPTRPTLLKLTWVKKYDQGLFSALSENAKLIYLDLAIREAWKNVQ